MRGFDAVVAVGSGTVNDLCKYVTGLDGRRYCVFGTAASMNGYTSSTASITLDSGLKVSLSSHAPAGFFVDLRVSAAAPPYLAASGFADCLARSVAQIGLVDVRTGCWERHISRSCPTRYRLPIEIENSTNARAPATSPKGDIAAIGYLYRVLTLCGLGISFTGVSHHGSMGEHQISHYIDCFAGGKAPRQPAWTAGGYRIPDHGAAAAAYARRSQACCRSDATQIDMRPT